jgi:drug/metabolite transporter (DMT)-like permease
MMWLVILFYALFTCSFPISKILVAYAPPLFVASIRTLLAGFFLLAYCFSRKNNCKQRCTIAIPHSWLFIQLIVICIFINYTTRFWAINYLPSSKASLLFSIDPVLTLLFSYLLLGETNTKKQWLGFCFGFFSLIPALITSSPTEAPWGEFLYISWPELLILVSVITNSYRWVLMRKLINHHDYSVSFVNGVSLAAGGILCLISSFFIEGFLPVSHPLPFCGWILLAVLISNVVCASLYGYLLRSYTATFLSLAGLMSPLFGALYGSLFFGELISWHYFLAIFLLSISMYLFYKDEILHKNKDY